MRAVSIESIGRGTDTNGLVLEMRRLRHGKDCLESRICFKVETVTRTERAFPGKERNFFTSRSHNGSGPDRREE